MNACVRFVLLGLALAVAGCDAGGASNAEPLEPLSNFFRPLPESPVYPEDNPFSLEKETLGELLFWDPILSGDLNVACASCHHPNHGWADGRRVSVGSDGVGLGPARQGVELTEFNSPTVLNVAFGGMGIDDPEADFIAGPFFWDARAPTLEEQALDPIKSQVEMLGRNFEPDEAMPLIIDRLQNIPEYVALFDAAFTGPDTITEDNIARALATFQRKLVTSRTAFDRYLEGDSEALSLGEIAGLNRFVNGGCARCHSGVLLSDFSVHNTEPVLRGLPAVRTAPLRTATLTAPFMHNGSRTSLRDAIDEYEDRGDLDVEFDDDDTSSVAEFIRVLNQGDFYRAIPATVPSGLPVGGNIN